MGSLGRAISDVQMRPLGLLSLLRVFRPFIKAVTCSAASGVLQMQAKSGAVRVILLVISFLVAGEDIAGLKLSTPG